ncbi:ATP-binding protein [Ralstonia pseudosolanacearum]|uniref:ATP-binding protein n=1 Tax=Ralstonia pseudosolanacearum TaxID=1310165 RepID=UPI00339A9F68
MADKSANANPTKRFFVDMLIKDIELQDAILDLLDNCVDGAMRSIEEVKRGAARSYEGYYASIDFDKDQFTIRDNCGGISLDLAQSYAFRMGRPDAERDTDLPTVGVYGIGMKRAVFKLGRNITVKSRTKSEGFSLEITPAWLESDSTWALPLTESSDVLDDVGTEISVKTLRDGIPRVFADETDFENTLKNAISAYYGYIIERGFEVRVNGSIISPVKVSLLFDERDWAEKEKISPYVYKGEIDGVDVSIVVGLYRSLPTDAEEQEALQRPSSERAGWTIVCNDRVVLYSDKSKVTGWGEATVPQYHTQFVSIAGTVVFRSNNAAKLPLTTTKRGIDGNSELYLTAKEFMREGLKIFTDFTNKWKSSSRELSALNAQISTTTPEAAQARIPADRWTTVRGGGGGKRYKPNLPLPREEDPLRQVKFSRRTSEIQKVSSYLFDDAAVSASDVGAKCFDDILKRAKQ